MAPHWEGLNEFLSVAEHGSFTQAANKLDITVVSVSRRVAALEAYLGVEAVSSHHPQSVTHRRR
ncbi:helix-turn-helix domain-containing protein [Salinivibrio costicola]|uniref:helix-turn-helix domain-containing protein n=1 Tax=Salinivibrio costicola TaxID=51367 RepID=UPI000A75BDB3|nr:LysR family transcriptional regulator [Salinivibrio costicola]